MTIQFSCPKCQSKLWAPDDKAGAKFPCPECGQRLQVPPPPNKTILGQVISPNETLPGQPTPQTNPLPAWLSELEPTTTRPAWLSELEPAAAPMGGTEQAQSAAKEPLPPLERPADAAAEIICRACGRRLRVPGKLMGNWARCPGCLILFMAKTPGTEKGEQPSAAVIRQQPLSLVKGEASDLCLADDPRLKATNPPRWWRPVSPSFLILSLLLFPLPWIEVRCSSGEMYGKVLASQSGLQSIYGGETLHPALEAERVKREKAHLPDTSRRTTHSGDFGFFDSFAPTMLLYPLLLVGAAFIGFFLRPSLQRSALICAFAGVAFLLLLLQAAIGFPLERRVNKAMVAAAAEREPFDDGAGTMAALAFDVRYTGWFWVGLLSNVAALLALALEWFVIGFCYPSRRFLPWLGGRPSGP
jgi:DNA-directed RNA polymerase subunit RPC12/RpoP